MKKLFPLAMTGIPLLGAGLLAWASGSPEANSDKQITVKGVPCKIVTEADGTERVSLRGLPVSMAVSHQDSNGNISIQCAEQEVALPESSNLPAQ